MSALQQITKSSAFRPILFSLVAYGLFEAHFTTTQMNEEARSAPIRVFQPFESIEVSSTLDRLPDLLVDGESEGPVEANLNIAFGLLPEPVVVPEPEPMPVPEPEPQPVAPPPPPPVDHGAILREALLPRIDAITGKGVFLSGVYYAIGDELDSTHLVSARLAGVAWQDRTPVLEVRYAGKLHRVAVEDSG